MSVSLSYLELYNVTYSEDDYHDYLKVVVFLSLIVHMINDPFEPR